MQDNNIHTMLIIIRFELTKLTEKRQKSEQTERYWQSVMKKNSTKTKQKTPYNQQEQLFRCQGR